MIIGEMDFNSSSEDDLLGFHCLYSHRGCDGRVCMKPFSGRRLWLFQFGKRHRQFRDRKLYALQLDRARTGAVRQRVDIAVHSVGNTSGGQWNR